MLLCLVVLLCVCLLNVSTDKVRSSLLMQSIISQPQRRIVSGEDVNIEDYPFMSFVIHKKPNSDTGVILCGGTIINATHVLTAAHCVGTCAVNHELLNTCQELSPDKFTVYIGVTNPTLSEESNIFSVKRIHVHPNYENIAWDCVGRYDIAVLELRKPIKFSKKASPVTLPEAVHVEGVTNSKTNAYGNDRTVCTILGWGSTSESEQIASLDRNLKVAHVPLIDTPSCLNYALIEGVQYCYDTHICSMDPMNASGICSGDSGGPILCDGEQVGVTSGALKCVGPNSPNSFTRTDINIHWLKGIYEDKHKGRTSRKPKGRNEAKITHLDSYLFVIYCLIVNTFQ